MGKSASKRTEVSPPSGTGLVSGMGESFSLDLNSGQGNYNIGFDVPDGIAGLKPSIKFEYAHCNRNGIWGFGWKFAGRQIDRRLDLGTDKNRQEIFLDTGTELKHAGNKIFHPLRESAFNRYERKSDHWIVREKDGSKYFFGLTANSRIADPLHPERVQTWLLERQEDVHGNRITYHYSTDEGFPYLLEIRYAKFIIRFSYEERPDKITNGKAGFIRTIGKRCKEISLHLAAEEQVVRRLDFTYTNLPYNKVSLITSCQLTGFAEGEPEVKKNPVVFSYSGFDPASYQVGWVGTEGGNPAPPPLTDPDSVLITLDSLPLPGILSQRNGKYFYWPNNGKGSWAFPHVLPRAPFTSSFRGEGLQFMDMDATGLADLMVGIGSNPLNGYYPNRGPQGFGDFILYPRQSRSLPPFESGRIRLGDINGDGIVDAVYTASRGIVQYRNQAEAGWEPGTITANNPQIDFADPLVFLADMTGDGLPDIVRVRSGLVEYWLNLGSRGFGERKEMRHSPRLNGITYHPEELLLLDVDGDGVTDLVHISGNKISVYLNQQGEGFSDPIVYNNIPPPIPGTVKAVDMHGKGMTGLLYNSLRSGQSGYVYFRIDQATPPYLLQAVDNGIGIRSEIHYSPVVEMAQGDEAAIGSPHTFIPFALWVVSSTIEKDYIRNTTKQVSYRYQEGLYDVVSRRFQGFRRVEKTEGGDESRSDVLTRYTFLMNQAAQPGKTRTHAHLDRLLEKVEVFSLDGSSAAALPYHVEQTRYGLDVLDHFEDGTMRVFVYAAQVLKTYHERTADARVEERILEYDEAGNVKRETMRGFGTNSGTPVEEKKVITEIEYAKDPSSLIYKMARVVKRDQDGNIILELRQYYDGPSFAGLPLGQLTKGQLVKEEHLVMSEAAYTAHYGAMDMGASGHFIQADADGNSAVFGLKKTLSYTADGNQEVETKGNGFKRKKIYDADKLFVIEELTNEKSVKRTNHPVSGKPMRLIAHSGAKLEMTYDAFGRMTTYRVGEDTVNRPTRKIEYNDTAVPNFRTIRYRISEDHFTSTITYFDGKGEELQQRVQRTDTEILVSAWMEKNPWDQVKKEYEPFISNTFDFSIPAPDSASRATFYDGEGRPVKTINFNGAQSTVSFMPFEISIYDAHDHNAAHAGHQTPRREQVDVWNNRTAIIEDDGGTNVRTTTYRVGLFGQILELSDQVGKSCSYVYDLCGNRLQIEHTEAGTRKQFFNSCNEIVRTKDSTGNDVEIIRDKDSRITQVLLNGQEVESFIYDDTTAAVDGRLTSVDYHNGSQAFSYTERGFLKQHTVKVDNQQFDIRYEYNDMGKQTAIIYPDGTRLTQTHYLNGFIKSIEGVITQLTYDAANHPLKIAFANGLTTEITYEPGMIGHIRHQQTKNKNGLVIEDVAFTYDELMQLVQMQDAAPGVNHLANYTFDNFNQITRVQGQDRNSTYESDYSYVQGRNLSQIGESGCQLEYKDPLRPHRLTEVLDGGIQLAIGYDTNGNITSIGGKQLSFNFKNQLQSVSMDDGSVVSFDYDYRGNRVRRKRMEANGHETTTIYLGRLVEVRNNNFTNYVVLGNKRIMQITASSKYWFHYDALGSIKFFSDEVGKKSAQIEYFPFGNERVRNGSPVLRTFALHEYDPDIDLIYMGHRWYAPRMGRFITPDPLYLYQPEKSEGEPRKLSMYTYVGNNPVTNIDPSGLSFWSVVGAIAGVVVGVIAAVIIVAAFATGIGFGILAVAGLIALVTVSYIVAHNNQGNGLGEFFRGFMIGLNAGLNATFLAMMGPVGAFLGGFIGTLIFLSAFDTIAGNQAYQGLLGWANFIMPMSWLVIGLGAIMWILNGLGHLIFWYIPSLWGGGIEFFRITGFKMDWSTGMLATKGGWIANLNPIDTAYNMGNFAYVDTNSSSWHLDHEAGHNLNLAVFGSIFHFVGFIHEMGTPAGANALSEKLAEGNDPSSTGSFHPMWT